jgi:hypothetical protein
MQRTVEETRKFTSKMKITINQLLALALLAITASGLPVSCTYDYFVDETNYRVYVPEVANGTVSDCFVAVYDDKGQLMRSRRTGHADRDPRVAMGIFNFRLPPGKYTTYCYADLGDMPIEEEHSEALAFFATRRLPAPPEHAHAEPAEVKYQILEPEIKPDYKLKTDTTAIARYVGRITVHFKNIPVPVRQVARVRMEATGVGTRQLFRQDSVSTRFTAGDCMYDDFEFVPLSSPNEWAVSRRYFPSMPGQAMRVRFHFIDAAGRNISTLPVDLVDNKTGAPVVLHRGEHVIIEVDSYLVTGVSLVGWNETIKETGKDI